MVLKNLDIVLAFASLMLILSLIITTVVQAAVSLVSLRGYNLVGGVTRLFQQLDPVFTETISKELSRKLLSHPAVARSFGRVTQAIGKEEFTRLVNDLATTNQVQLTADAKAALQVYVDRVVVNLPKGQQLALAAAADALPKEVAVSFNQAAERVAGSVQKVSVDVANWFDTVLDRTRDTFVLQTRVITAVAAIALAVGLRVDSLYLFQQLSTNDAARTSLVESAQPLLEQASRATPATSDPAQVRAQLTGLQKQLADTQLQVFAKTWDEVRFAGLAMTAVFLSLGAPFWFNLLRQMSSLRPSIARVVDPKSGQA